MCTHNALGVRIYRAFPKREGSGFSLIHGCYFMGGTPYPLRAAQRTRWGVRGASPEENFKKRSQMVASDGICGKDIDL